MSRTRRIGWGAALGTALAAVAVTAAGCAGVQPGGPGAVLTTDPAPPPSCPATLPATLPDVPGPNLVPDGVSAAIACRYQGLNDPHPNALAQSGPVTGNQLNTLVATLNAAKPWPPGRFCPIDLGLNDLIVFSYPSGQADVRVNVTGCPSAANGHKTVQAGGDVLSQLATLVGASPRPSA